MNIIIIIIIIIINIIIIISNSSSSSSSSINIIRIYTHHYKVLKPTNYPIYLFRVLF